MPPRNEKIAQYVKELAAEFLSRENNRTSLITVTNTTVSPDMKRATVFVTVLPVTMEKGAIDFLKRKRADLRDYLKKNMQVKIIPFLDIEIDRGEKNRQKIDELLRE